MSSWRTPVATCEALVNSMPKRVKAVLENNGGHTQYWHFGPNLDIFTYGVLPFVASGLDINSCVLSYFERTALLRCYTICTLTTLHCSKVSFLWKDIIKYLQKCGVLTSVRYCICFYNGKRWLIELRRILGWNEYPVRIKHFCRVRVSYE